MREDSYWGHVQPIGNIGVPVGVAMENRDTGADTLAALFREQRRRAGAARRGNATPTIPADTTITVDAARPGFTTQASGSWTQWADGGDGDNRPPAA
jgi:hypothetical protein